MMAYIDKDLLLKDIGESVVFTVRNAETSPQIRGARKIIDRIKNAPTADVVEVVRCCNCRYFFTNIDKETYCDIHSKLSDKFYVKQNDFCSYGERRDT